MNTVNVEQIYQAFKDNTGVISLTAFQQWSKDPANLTIKTQHKNLSLEDFFKSIYVSMDHTPVNYGILYDDTTFGEVDTFDGVALAIQETYPEVVQK